MSNNNSSQERISQKLSTKSESKGKKGMAIGIACASVALVVVVAVVLIFVQPSTAEKRNVVVTPENVDEILADMEEASKSQPGQFEVTMNSTWEFESGDVASSNAYVGNSTANNNDVYFDIVLADSEETIFESPIIPVGSHLESITLDKALEAGTYDCVLTYHLLDENDEPTSTLNIAVTIVIHN